MSFNSETYRLAAAEHVIAAAELYRCKRFVLCHYVSGLAVECILRAYRYRRDPEFDARHDLLVLFYASGIESSIPASRFGLAEEALRTVIRRWSNDHRFRSQAELRRHLREINVHRGIKGDFVKESARRIAEAASVFVREGLDAWKRS